MPRIQIIDEKKYPLQMNQEDGLYYYRWEHRATLSRGFKKYIVFIDNGIRNEQGKILTWPKAYIEEMTSKGTEQIEDDSLFEELHLFCEEKNFIEVQLPIRKQ
jgi:hypothetical protein